MTRTPLTVSLPVCPSCGHIGKLPIALSRKDWCNGGIKAQHKAIKMQPRTFAEVIDDLPAEDTRRPLGRAA
jgi:hypothetical protein